MEVIFRDEIGTFIRQECIRVERWFLIMITDIEQQTLDIDWYFTNNEYVAFAASGGGKLPYSVAKSKNNNDLLNEFFHGLPEISEIIISPGLGKTIKSKVDEAYLNCFTNMCRKGLFSYDRTVLNNFSYSRYHLVVKPVYPLIIDKLPLNIREILAETIYNGKMETIIDSISIR